MLWDGLLDSPPLEGATNSSGVAGNRLILCADRSLLDNMKLEGVGKPIGLGAVIVRLRLYCLPIGLFIELASKDRAISFAYTRI